MNTENLLKVHKVLIACDLKMLSEKLEIIRNIDIGDLVNEMEDNLHIKINDPQGRIAYLRKVAAELDTTKRISILETWSKNRYGGFGNMELFKKFILELSMLEIDIFVLIYKTCKLFDINCLDISKKINEVGENMLNAELQQFGWENNRIYYIGNNIEKKYFTEETPMQNDPPPQQTETTPAIKTKVKKVKSEPPENLKLIDLFEDVNKYHRVMETLTGKYIDKDTQLYTKTRTGHKKEIVQLILSLHVKGYYKKNKKPTSQEIELIAQNTLGVTISPATIKHNTEIDKRLFAEIVPAAYNL